MKKIILLLSLLPLAACTQSYEDLTQWMTQTRQEAKSKIIPFEEPTVTLPKPYNPPNFKGLNAFDSRRLDTASKGGNAPDVNRPKETLEAFSLENMTFVGTLQSGGKVSGFIKVNDHVYTVYPGNYIGQNYGRIQSITEDKIILTEQVEDSYGNWVYRKAELPLSSKDADSSDSSDSSNSN